MVAALLIFLFWLAIGGRLAAYAKFATTDGAGDSEFWSGVRRLFLSSPVASTTQGPASPALPPTGQSPGVTPRGGGSGAASPQPPSTLPGGPMVNPDIPNTWPGPMLIP